MLEPEQLAQQAVAWIRNHRDGCSDATCAEPYNAAAFIAHCMGVRTDRINEFLGHLAKYEAGCQGCVHVRN